MTEKESNKGIPNENTKDSSSKNDLQKVVLPRTSGSTTFGHIVPDDDDEVIAPITIAPDGGWGWVVVAASFWHIFCIEGISFTFGTMKGFIMHDLQKDIASVAVVNSITIGFMCLFGPIASALINRFGFRITSMLGAVLSFFGAFMTSVGGDYTTLLIFYGGFMGLGFSLTTSSSSLIVGFYFQKRRSLATALSLCGNSLGVSIMAAVAFYLNGIGWRSTVMLQSAMLGTMFFTSMVFRPLLSITVQLVTESTPKRMLSTPYVSEASFKTAKKRRASVANAEYKRAKDFVAEQEPLSKELLIGTDNRHKSGPKVISTVNLQSLSRKFSKELEILDLEQKGDNFLITILNKEDEKRKGCCSRIFSWSPHVEEARPLYRDDAFYTGNVIKLDEYRSSTNIAESNTGIEYNLAVSRVTTLKDIKEKKGFCSTAVKRVLMTMADPRLLKQKSFFLFLFSVFFSYLGIIIPYVYVIDRSKEFKVPKKHYEWFVSVIALSGLFGRIIIGIIATKIPAIYCCQLSAFVAGLSSIISNYFYNYPLQYLYCIVFGFFMSGVVVCRYLILVDLYGLELLTNGAGLTMLTQGLAFLLTLPVAGLIMTRLGVFFSFAYSAICCFCGALSFCFVPLARNHEKKNSK